MAGGYALLGTPPAGNQSQRSFETPFHLTLRRPLKAAVSKDEVKRLLRMRSRG